MLGADISLETVDRMMAGCKSIPDPTSILADSAALLISALHLAIFIQVTCVEAALKLKM